MDLLIRISFLAGFFFLMNLEVFSQTSESIRADRPGQAFTPFTVGKGIFQLQSGLIYQRQSSLVGPSDPTSGPVELTQKFFTIDNFFRYGLTEKWEVSATFNWSRGWTESDTLEETTNGISNWGFSTRINLADFNGGTTGLGVLGGVNFTNEVSEEFETEKVTPNLALLFTHSFSFMGVSANLGPVWDGSSYDIESGSYVLNFSFSLPANLGLFVENFGTFGSGEFDTFFDGGISFVPNNDLQLDLFAGFGENGDISDAFVSTGVSWRIK